MQSDQIARSKMNLKVLESTDILHEQDDHSSVMIILGLPGSMFATL